jgi:uncharacterized protein (UPF0276 family)
VNLAGSTTSRPAVISGFGLGLRTAHYPELLGAGPVAGVDWLELLSDNYLVPGGKPLAMMDAAAERYPVVLHGVAMNLGSADGPDPAYLARLGRLVRRTGACWVSDHLCWNGVDGTRLHDLMPLPYTEEALRLVARHVDQVQQALGMALVVENVSSYLQFSCSDHDEAAFLAALCADTGCRLLLDVNNVYVSAVNHGFDAQHYLDTLPADRIAQIHLAGHSDHGSHLVDTHDQPVAAPVWSLYEDALRRFGPVPTMIERDDHIPPLAELLAELGQARHIAQATLAAPRLAA